jgi:charged multivesicular body protein 6
MLGGRISNQDEDEVENELAELEREINGPGPLPAVPDTELRTEPQTKVQKQPDRQQERRPERQKMLAA